MSTTKYSDEPRLQALFVESYTEGLATRKPIGPQRADRIRRLLWPELNTPTARRTAA